MRLACLLRYGRGDGRRFRRVGLELVTVMGVTACIWSDVLNGTMGLARIGADGDPAV
jgi:hypothetical protein